MILQFSFLKSLVSLHLEQLNQECFVIRIIGVDFGGCAVVHHCWFNFLFIASCCFFFVNHHVVIVALLCVAISIQNAFEGFLYASPSWISSTGRCLFNGSIQKEQNCSQCFCFNSITICFIWFERSLVAGRVPCIAVIHCI